MAIRKKCFMDLMMKMIESGVHNGICNVVLSGCSVCMVLLCDGVAHMLADGNSSPFCLFKDEQCMYTQWCRAVIGAAFCSTPYFLIFSLYSTLVCSRENRGSHLMAGHLPGSPMGTQNL